MRITSLFTIALASLALAACGPGASSDDTSADDTSDPDANPNDPPDADTTSPKQLGSACTPDTANPMGPGDCGAGFTCLALDGGGGAWCSKTCAANSGATTCDPGYVGAGLGYCYLGVDFDGDMAADGTFCGIICSDTTGMCTDCNDSCPTPLACTAPLMSGGATVAMGCQ